MRAHGGSWLAAAALLGFALDAAAAAPANSPLDFGNIGGAWIRARGANGQAAERAGADRQAASDDPEMPVDMNGDPVPLQPWARAVYEERAKNLREGRPYASTKARCMPAGLPRTMDPPGRLGLQVLVTPGQVTVLMEEFTQFRIIHMGASHPPADELEPTLLGHSIGRWEGATLVVDTVGISTITTIDTLGTPHSDKMHVVERISRQGDILEVDMTIDDPGAYTRPWKTRSRFQPLPDGLKEYFCENDRNSATEGGHSGVELPGAK